MENKQPNGQGFDERVLSVVVPAYNEEEVINEFHRRLVSTLTGMNSYWEIIYVNDGSSDSTEEILHEFHEADARVSVIDLSRNFGKEIALSAGIDYARGDAVVVLDADLQDPPEVIPQLFAHWIEGYDVIYAKRASRAGETALKKVSSHVFYRLMNKVARVAIPEDTGDFRLLSRRAVDSLKELREHHRFMKGLFSWIGFEQKAITYQRDPRYAGKTKWNYWKLWNFALEGITSFTTTPLLVASYLGLLTSLSAFLYAVYVIYKTVLYGEPVRGYPSLMVVILFLGGVQLLAMGVIGEYIGRIFNETKQRPLYVIRNYRPSDKNAITEVPPEK